MLVRAELSDGPGGVKSVPQHCADVHPGGKEYVELPPALARGWLVASATLRVKTWPIRNPARDTPDTKAYIFVSADSRNVPVASAGCEDAASHRCKVRANGKIIVSADDTQASPVTVDEVLNYGPGRR